MEKEEIKVDASKYGLQVFLDIEIKYCHTFQLEFSKVRKDPRKFYRRGYEETTIYAVDSKKVLLKTSENSSLFARSIEGNNNYFHFKYDGLECQFMDTDPKIKFSVRKSSFSGNTPHLRITATKYDDSGNPITWDAFNGSINQFDKEIDIVNR